MASMFCPQCRLEQPRDHVYCIRCSASLPGYLLDDEAPSKRMRFFAGLRITDADPEGAFLRVSCYLKEQTFNTPEGSVKIPGNHVRFSVWVGSEARSVISIPESEARELAAFITEELRRLNHGSEDLSPTGKE